MSENFKCALCQIVDKAQHAMDYPDNGTTLLDYFKDIHKIASVALIKGILGRDEPPPCEHRNEKA